jgi:pimeloyl-ACP methyl ester carboxylesterase
MDTTPVGRNPAPITAVLVHGAFVDGSGWQAVHDILVKQGNEVLVVQNSTATLAGDVAAARQAIVAAQYPVILVGHSYGGAVITEAGNDPRVQSLVYIAAFVPDTGESVQTFVTRPAPEGTPTAPVLPARGGFLTLDKAEMPRAFAADADPALARFMANAQVPWGIEAIAGKITEAAWKAKPVYFLLATEDRMVPPALQREMAERARAEITEVASSHAVMLTQPNAVAQLINAAATAIR